MIDKKVISALGILSDTDLRRQLCGKVIGTGVTRQVHECKLSKYYVVKWDYSGTFANVAEWLIWDYYAPAPWYAKWFAKCIFISKNGHFLIQEKLTFKEKKKDYPKQVPVFFTDIGIKNFGFVGNQLKSCDYANVIGRMTGLMTKKMRVAKW